VSSRNPIEIPGGAAGGGHGITATFPNEADDRNKPGSCCQ